MEHYGSGGRKCLCSPGAEKLNFRNGLGRTSSGKNSRAFFGGFLDHGSGLRFFPVRILEKNNLTSIKQKAHDDLMTRLESMESALKKNEGTLLEKQSLIDKLNVDVTKLNKERRTQNQVVQNLAYKGATYVGIAGSSQLNPVNFI